MKGIMDSFKDERTIPYFRDEAINQVKVAYRIKEYLDPDSVCPAKNLSEETMNFFLNKDFTSAIGNIFYEVGIENELNNDIIFETIKFSSYMFNKYIKNKKREFVTEKERLLNRLAEINDALTNY